jgi:hypothetical protein
VYGNGDWRPAKTSPQILRMQRKAEMWEGWNGGAERDRTAGLLVANEALSQLSYSPTSDLVILAAAPDSRKRSPVGGERRKKGLNQAECEEGSFDKTACFP